MRPHRWQLTRLPRPWDSPGKNTGVGCHFLLQCKKVKSESEVAHSCPTPSDPINSSLPASSIHGICQARVLEWIAIAFSSWVLYCSFIFYFIACASYLYYLLSSLVFSFGLLLFSSFFRWTLQLLMLRLSSFPNTHLSL